MGYMLAACAVLSAAAIQPVIAGAAGKNRTITTHELFITGNKTTQYLLLE